MKRRFPPLWGFAALVALNIACLLFLSCAPRPAAAAENCAALGKLWEWDAAKGRCTKNAEAVAAERAGRPCRAQIPVGWGSCQATVAAPEMLADGRTPELADGQSITLRDTRKPMIGEITRVCTGGLLKDARGADGARLRGSCYRQGSADDPAMAARK